MIVIVVAIIIVTRKRPLILRSPHATALMRPHLRQQNLTNEFRRCVVASATALFLLTGYSAAEANGESPPAASTLQFSTTNFDTTSLSITPKAQASLRETHLEVQWQTPRTVETAYHWSSSFMHKYRAITLMGLTPRADFNGDVHLLGWGLYGWRTSGHHWRRLSIVPVLATSSNALKNPDALTSDALAAWLSWTEHYAPTTTTGWLLGFGLDDRLGRYTLYPIGGITWQPRAGTFLQLAYPDMRLTLHVTTLVVLNVNLTPDGGKWRVYSKNLENQADFEWKNWRASLGLKWVHTQGLLIELRGGVLLQQHMRIPLEDGTVATTDLDEAAFATFTAGWHWR